MIIKWLKYLKIILFSVLKEKSINDYTMAEMFRYQDPFAGIKYIVVYQVKFYNCVVNNLI